MYNANQKLMVARELSRSGYNVPAAQHALRSNYQSFGTISQTTIRRMKRDPYFNLMLEDQGNILVEARRATRVETEMARERAGALCNDPLRQKLAAAIEELHALARANPCPRTYKVLLEYLELMRSMEVPQRGWRPVLTPELKERRPPPGVETETYTYDPRDWPQIHYTQRQQPPAAAETETEMTTETGAEAERETGTEAGTGAATETQTGTGAGAETEGKCDPPPPQSQA